jgi:hypothetical protein
VIAKSFLILCRLLLTEFDVIGRNAARDASYQGSAAACGHVCVGALKMA